MHESLQEMISYLRQERCPRAVLDRVNTRIKTEKQGEGRLAMSAVRLGVVAASALIILAAAIWQGGRAVNSPSQAEPPSIRADRELLARQTEGALAYLGLTLRHAADQTREALLNSAVPPLRNSLEKVKNNMQSNQL